MTEPDRKALIREYKDSPRPSGIFQVRNTASGKMLIGATFDLPGMLNRQRFQLEMGSHPDKELQADWNALGQDVFEISVLDTLDPAREPSADPREELRLLHQMWLEKLADGPLYALSKRGI